MGPKIPSDIKQTLLTIFEKGFYLQFWNTLIFDQEFVVAILGIALVKLILIKYCDNL